MKRQKVGERNITDVSMTKDKSRTRNVDPWSRISERSCNPMFHPWLRVNIAVCHQMLTLKPCTTGTSIKVNFTTEPVTNSSWTSIGMKRTTIGHFSRKGKNRSNERTTWKKKAIIMNEDEEECVRNVEKNIARCFILFPLIQFIFLMKMSHFYLICQ